MIEEVSEEPTADSEVKDETEAEPREVSNRQQLWSTNEKLNDHLDLL